MAHRSSVMGLILILVTIFWAGATAQSSCTSVLISLSPCLNYITGNSSTPSAQCCTQLASVVRSSPQCLCEVLNGGGSSLGINVNQSQALALPSNCNVQTPPISSCNGKNAIKIFNENKMLKTSLIKDHHVLSLTTTPLPVSAASPANAPAGSPESPSTVPGTASLMYHFTCHLKRAILCTLSFEYPIST